MDNKYILAYKVKIKNLPLATHKMKVNLQNLESKVINIIIIDNCYAIVLVSIRGNYPFIMSEWEEFIEQ